jgi:hypothetical protein
MSQCNQHIITNININTNILRPKICSWRLEGSIDKPLACSDICQQRHILSMSHTHTHTHIHTNDSVNGKYFPNNSKFATVRIRSTNTQLFIVANLKQLHVPAAQGNHDQAVCFRNVKII